MQKNIIKSEKLNEEIHYRELDNGLKIFFMPKKDYLKKYAIFATNYGSNDNIFVPIGENEEIEVPEGIAHFLEHKLFEEPDGNIFNEFSKLGSFVNAYTNFTQTAYLFSCTDRFYENLQLLIKFVQNPYFTDENVNKEKGIIEQEIKMYEDNANWKVFFNCLRGMYHKHPVKIDIAGTIESINKVDKETLYKCYNTFYNLKNMVVFLIGDINFDEAIEVIEKNTTKEDKETTADIKRIFPEEPKTVAQKNVEESLTIAQPLFNIGFKDIDVGYDGDKLVKKEISTNILLDMLFGDSSEFYQSLYDEGLINNTFGSQYIGSRDYGHSILGGESPNPKAVLDKILKQIDTIKKKGVSKEDFERIKKKHIGYHLMDFNSVEFIATNFVTYFFNNSSILSYLELLENLDFKDVEDRFLNHFTEENYTLSIINKK